MQKKAENKDIKLDAIDRRLLEILHENSRITMSQLAKQARVSRDVAEYRFSRLKSLAVITSCIAVIQQPIFCEGIARLECALIQASGEEMANTFRRLAQHEAVNWISELCGPANAYCTVFYRSPADLAKTVSEILIILQGVLREHRVTLYTTELKFDRLGAITGKPKQGFQSAAFTGYSPVNLDTHDKQILSALAVDARTSNTILARQLDVSEDTVRLRIKKLCLSGVISHFTIVVNPYVLKKENYVLNLTLDSSQVQAEKTLQSFVQTRPALAFCALTAGTHNLTLSYYCSSRNEFYDELRILRRQFSGAIHKEELLLGIAEHKEIFVPLSFIQ